MAGRTADRSRGCFFGSVFAVLMLCSFTGNVECKDYANLPALPYPYDALEPYISQEIMMLHHDKHHQAYTTKLNEAIATIKQNAPQEVVAAIPNAPARLLRNLTEMNQLFSPYVDAKTLTKLKNNLGGFINHKYFWDYMTPNRENNKMGPLITAALNEAFGNFENFKKQWEGNCTDLFGSGWVWLVYDLETGRVGLNTSKDQDSPMTFSQETILGIDLWEHAYYLQYKNVRATYVTQFWNIINWHVVESNLLAAVARRAENLAGGQAGLKAADTAAVADDDKSVAH